MRFLIYALVIFMLGASCLYSQQLALKDSFSRDGQLLMFIANMDGDVAPEYVVITDSSATIEIIDGRTRLTEYSVTLKLENNENLYTDDPASTRMRNLTLVQDYNGNGVKDLIISGGDPEPYIRVVDPKTGEDLLKVNIPLGDRLIEALDIDGDEYYDLIISGGFQTNIYATQARVAKATSADDGVRGNGMAIYPNFPNPVQNSTTLAWEQPETAEATVTIYDGQGKVVQRAFKGVAREGVNLCKWDGADAEGRRVSSGAYRVQVESKGKIAGGALQVAR